MWKASGRRSQSTPCSSGRSTRALRGISLQSMGTEPSISAEQSHFKEDLDPTRSNFLQNFLDCIEDSGHDVHQDGKREHPLMPLIRRPSCTHQLAIIAMLPPLTYSKLFTAVIEQVVHNSNTHRKLSCQHGEPTARFPF